MISGSLGRPKVDMIKVKIRTSVIDFFNQGIGVLVDVADVAMLA